MSKEKREEYHQEETKSTLEKTVEIESNPALYYTAEDAAEDKNGAGYTESDKTVLRKIKERETKPY